MEPPRNVEDTVSLRNSDRVEFMHGKTSQLATPAGLRRMGKWERFCMGNTVTWGDGRYLLLIVPINGALLVDKRHARKNMA